MRSLLGDERGGRHARLRIGFQYEQAGFALLVVGFVAGRIPDLAVNIPLIKGFSVVGVRAGEYARRFPDRGRRISAEVSRLASTGEVRPTVDRLVTISQWREAFGAMAAGQLVGKLVFQPG